MGVVYNRQRYKNADQEQSEAVRWLEIGSVVLTSTCRHRARFSNLASSSPLQTRNLRPQTYQLLIPTLAHFSRPSGCSRHGVFPCTLITRKQRSSFETQLYLVTCSRTAVQACEARRSLPELQIVSCACILYSSDLVSALALPGPLCMIRLRIATSSETQLLFRSLLRS